MRKVLIAAALAATTQFVNAAGGAWDGIYSCGINVRGSFFQTFVTINGQSDGRAIFAVAAVTEFTPFYGFGIGAVSGNVFSGNTMFGLPFTATRTALGFNVSIQTLVNSVVVPATGNCQQIW
jgi:hypothetical protein